ncbi:MAG: DUF2461 family protein, partial [Spirochaetaceae bacterium]|nr:DUF2461 family protein [Spirochaetaceae bacterium]
MTDITKPHAPITHSFGPYLSFIFKSKFAIGPIDRTYTCYYFFNTLMSQKILTILPACNNKKIVFKYNTGNAMDTKLILNFLNELNENNSLQWMKNNKQKYEQAKYEFENILFELIKQINIFDNSIKKPDP